MGEYSRLHRRSPSGAGEDEVASDRDPQVTQQEPPTEITHADRDRALSAFRRVLRASDITVWSAADANLRTLVWENVGCADNGPPPTTSDVQASMVWCNAVEAARVELCDRAPSISPVAFGQIDFLDSPWGDESLQPFADITA